MRGIEGSGDSGKTGLVMKNIIDDQYRCQPHTGLQGKGGEQQQQQHVNTR